MNKSRTLLTLGTLALGVSLVGIANADTIKQATNPQSADYAQHQTYMSPENYENMSDTMGVTITKKDQKTIDKDTDKPFANDNNAKTDDNPSVNMGPQMMNDNNSITFQKHMNEVHENNQEQMVEQHNSMTQQHQNFQSMPGYGHNEGTMQSHGMGTGHNGNHMGN